MIKLRQVALKYSIVVLAILFCACALLFAGCGKDATPDTKITITCYNGETVFKTLTTTQSEGYYVKIENPGDDITTKPASSTTYYSWYYDKNFTNLCHPDNLGYIKVTENTNLYCKTETIDTSKFQLTEIDSQYYIAGYIGDTDINTLVIPSYVGNIAVAGIRNSFKSNKSIQRVVICEGIQSIHTNSFQFCENIVSVVLPSSLKYVYDNVFGSCYGLKIINLPDNLTFNSSFLAGCTALTDIYISSNIKNLGTNTFAACKSLTNVYYGGTVTSWGNITKEGDADPMTNAKNFYIKDANGTVVYKGDNYRKIDLSLS